MVVDLDVTVCIYRILGKCLSMSLFGGGISWVKIYIRIVLNLRC